MKKNYLVTKKTVFIAIFVTLFIACIILFFILIFPSSKPKITRKIDLPNQIIGNWTVKNPPKPPRDPKMPKEYVPPLPQYNLTFSSGPDNNFSLDLNGTQIQGTYVVSGNIIQLIPQGRNYRFEVGAMAKDDEIIGDNNMIWSRVGSVSENPSPASNTPVTPPVTPATPETPTNPTTPVAPTPTTPVGPITPI